MGHTHTHKANQHKRILLIAILIALVFIVVEVVGGIIARSLALMSDALHLFADVGALVLGWIISHLLQKPATQRLSYGYHRAEALGALASALILWALCSVLVYHAVDRFLHPEPVRGGVVFVVAALGLAANYAMMRVLHPAHKENLNMRAAYLHVISDLLGSVGVLFSGVVILLTGWNPIDPIITILIAVAIIYSTIKVFRQSLAILMESTPPGLDSDALYQTLKELPAVEEVHDLHIWSISSNDPVLSVHLVSKDANRTLQAAHHTLEKKFGITHMTIQIEDHDHFDPKYCYDCQKKS